MKIKSQHMAIIIILFIFGSVGITSTLGLWKTTNDKVPTTYRDGEFAGQYNPLDIKGSYTFADIFNTFEVPVEDLSKAFGITDPSRYSTFQCKELEALYGFLAAEGKEVGTGSVRYFVALYKGLPFDAEEGTYLPKTAVDILKSKSKLTTEQIKNIEKYSVDLPVISSVSTTAPKSTEVSASEKAVKSSTTFKELLDWGVKREDIEKVINDKMPDSSKVVKDYTSTKGIEFSTIKDPLQKLVDAKK